MHTRGLVIVNTGDGKGKTTAAPGIALRAWGHDMRVCVIQFLKNGKFYSGEARGPEARGAAGDRILATIERPQTMDHGR